MSRPNTYEQNSPPPVRIELLPKRIESSINAVRKRVQETCGQYFHGAPNLWLPNGETIPNKGLKSGNFAYNNLPMTLEQMINGEIKTINLERFSKPRKYIEKPHGKVITSLIGEPIATKNLNPLSEEYTQILLIDNLGSSSMPDSWSPEFLEMAKKASYNEDITIGANGASATSGIFPHVQGIGVKSELLNSEEYKIPQENALRFHGLCWQLGISSYLRIKNGEFYLLVYLPQGTLESALTPFSKLDQKTQLNYLQALVTNTGIFENASNIRIDCKEIVDQVFTPIAQKYKDTYPNIDFADATTHSKPVATQLTLDQVQEMIQMMENGKHLHVTDSRVEIKNGFSSCKIIQKKLYRLRQRVEKIKYINLPKS